MGKLVLKPNPTFQKAVDVPVAGGEPAQITFTFRHRSRDDLAAWRATLGERPDVEIIPEMATAWDLAEPFDAENIAILAQNYQGAGRAMYTAYIEELMALRLGN